MSTPNSHKRLATLIVITLIFIIIAFSKPNMESIVSAKPIIDQNNSRDSSTPINTTIQIDRLPTLGESAIVNCIVSSALDAPGTNIKIELPDNAQLLQGDLNWQGNIRASDTVTLSARIAFNKVGNAAIFCRALRFIDENNTWGDLAELYIRIGQKDSSRGFASIPLENRLGYGEVIEAGDGSLIDDKGTSLAPLLTEDQITESIPSIEPSLNDKTLSSPPRVDMGSLTVTGRWSYYDRNDVYTGAREMLVQLVRGDNYNHLAWCYTDLNGYYSCGPVTNPGSVGIRTIMWTYTGYTPYSDILVVVNPNWGTTPSVDNAYGV